MQSTNKQPDGKARTITVSLKADLREQLFNDGRTGPIKAVQVSTERIFQLNGVLFDIDPVILRPDGLLGTIPTEPVAFYTNALKRLLDRDDVLQQAEVRISGRGLHVINWFAEPAPCDTDVAREEISRVLDVVVPLLPSDPFQPRLTALTRKVGSLNSRSKTRVEIIKAGTPVPYSAVRELARKIVAAPFKTIAGVLLGDEPISPCPICQADDSSLTLHGDVGHCYGCGCVTLAQVWDRLYLPKKAGKEGDRA
jgi:hypothetical protein